jgi:hypothetical protein
VQRKKMSGECASCADQSIDLLQCGEDEECDYEACLTDASSFEDIQGCCPGCTEKFDSTVACFDECLPDCVYETVVQYSACAMLRQCETGCKAAIEEAAADADNTVVTLLEDGIYDIDFEELKGELEGLSTDSLTCSFFEEEFETKICDIANCCPNCIDQFELVAECLINEVVYGQLLDSDTTCDVECGDNDRSFSGWGNGRLLQPDLPGDGPPGDGPPGDGDGPPIGDGSGLPEAFAVFEECEMIMAAYMVLGEAEGAYDAYMSCLLGSLAQFADGDGTAPPTESPTEEASGHQGSTNQMLALTIGSIAFLNMQLL